MKATALFLCVLSTVAALAIGAPNLRPAAPLNVTDADWKVNLSVIAYAGVKFGPTSFDYHGPGGMSGSGCGTDNQKCRCSDYPGGFMMAGVGTSDTWTGLTFGCMFTVDGNACAIYVDMPFSTSNSLTWSCPGYDLVGGQIAPSGHDFTQKMMVMKSV